MLKGVFPQFLIMVLCLRVLVLGAESHPFYDTLLAKKYSESIQNPLPVLHNTSMQSGYLVSPSARAFNDGLLSFGGFHAPPYGLWGIGAQALPFVHLSVNYKIMRGVTDPTLSPHGFGFYADRTGNVKIHLLQPTGGEEYLPHIAIGVEDITGSKLFSSRYIVCTEVIPKYHLDLSFGYGNGHMNGFFGGAAFYPLRFMGRSFFENTAFIVESDPTYYEADRHPQAHRQHLKWNFGLDFDVLSPMNIRVGYLKGHKILLGSTLAFDWGEKKELVRKVMEPEFYLSPKNREPIGKNRSKLETFGHWQLVFEDYGLELLSAYYTKTANGEREITLVFVNGSFVSQMELKECLWDIFATSLPSNIARVHLFEDIQGAVARRCTIESTHLQAYRDKKINVYEAYVLSTWKVKDVQLPPKEQRLWHVGKDAFNWNIDLRQNIMFGSARGKFKYSFGLSLSFDGFLFNKWYYNLSLGRPFITNIDQRDADWPIQTEKINVQSDELYYELPKKILVDQLYIQRNFSHKNALSSRVAVGYFEPMFAGLGSEILYYPENQNFAFGLEAALIKKRQTHGLGLMDKVRIGHKPASTRFVRFLGKQAFLSAYYMTGIWGIEARCKVGQFLAKDRGVRTEFYRQFKNGFRVGIWYTITNGNERVNGKTYYDKGFGLSIPLNFFSSKRNKGRTVDEFSPWLRDVGAMSSTGLNLYDTLKEERFP